MELSTKRYRIFSSYGSDNCIILSSIIFYNKNEGLQYRIKD
jgi:hypothetical protein